MVEYTIRDTETGKETTGTAERIMMLTDNEKDGRAIWVGTADLRDTRIIKLRKSGKIIREIAADVGVSVNTVYNVLKAHGVEASA